MSVSESIGDPLGSGPGEPEGWTDCHLHPQDSAWTLPRERLAGVCHELGALGFGLLVGLDRADRWDDLDEREPVIERGAGDLADLATIVADQRIAHLQVVLDPAECALLPLIAACRCGDWDAHLVSVTWGLTTVPDPTATTTAAAFCWSLAIGGPGLVVDATTMLGELQRSRVMKAGLERLERVLGVPCTVSIAAGD